MKKFLSSLIFISGGFIFAKPVFAHCPLCVAGAGAGLSLSRILGIDDSITGVWMGAFLGATAYWLSNMIKKTYIPFQNTVIYLTVFSTTVLSFYRLGLINEHNGLIANLPKLTFGIISGGILFYAVDILNNFIKRKNGKVLFPYQTIVLSLSSMTILSMAMFILINYYI